MKRASFYIICLALSVTTFTVNAQKGLQSDEIIQKLKTGNERFVQGKQVFGLLDEERRTETATHGQHPFATIIGCSDSRVPVEHVFDAGIGELFVIRVAGNVVNVDEAGSIEYGVEHLHTPVLVVLGHSQCGAVTAVAKNAEVHGNIPKLIENIEPAVAKAHQVHGNDFSDEFLEDAIKNNVFQSIEDLLHKSHVVNELISQHKLKVVGAIYHLESGNVEWLGEHPDQKKLLHN